MRFCPLARLLFPSSFFLSVLLTGCGSQPGQPVGPVLNPAGISGSIHGGQQPVSGATVSLVAPGLAGYGTAGTVIVSAQTDANGNFTLPRPYTCPANSGLVYLQSVGGNAGGGMNNAINLVAIAGNCTSLQATDFFVINEVTTVAAAYALAPFADVSSGTPVIGTSSTNLAGLVNAGSAAGALVNVHTGNARAATELTGVTLPTATVNTLGNILAACVNDGAAGNGSGNCTNLFSATTPAGGTAPKDTFAAAVQIALHPGLNTASLFTLPTAVAPFQSTLAAAPNDFALGLLFNGSAIAQSTYGPAGIDVDASGNAWVAVVATASTTSLLELSPGGSYLNGAGQVVPNVYQPQAVTITPTGNILVSDLYSDDVYQVTPGGSTSTAITAPNSSLSFSLAVDARDNSIWIPDAAFNTVAHRSATGTALAGSPYTTGTDPSGVAVAGSGDVWVTNSDQFESGTPNASVTHLTRGGDGSYTAANISTGASSIPFGIAIDNSGNAWVGLADSLAKYSPAGALLSPAGGYVTDSTNLDYTSTGCMQIDGLGRAFVAEGPSGPKSTPGSLAIFANDGTYLSKAAGGYGYTANNIIPGFNQSVHCLAIDGSGNVWISGQQANQSGGNAVVMMIGAAAPVVTPLSLATFPNKIGVRP